MFEQALSRDVVYSARPTVRVDQRDNSRVTNLLQAVTVTEQEGGLSALELRLHNIATSRANVADFAFEDDRVLKLGAAIAVYSGDEFTPREIFRGAITGLEALFSTQGIPELTVLAEDALQGARMARRTRVYADVSPADLARAIAGNLGLQPVITGLTAPVHTLVQLNESDLAFLRRILARHAADLQIVAEELHVAPRADVQRGAITLEAYSQLRAVRVLADLADQVSEVRVPGWDPHNGRTVEGVGDGEPRGPGSGRTGAAVLERAFAPRTHVLSHLAATTRDEADALAQAAYEQRARRFLQATGTCEGNAALRVGAAVTLTGLGPRFDNTYYVTRAVHRWDVASGYETDFEAECGYWGGQ